MKTMHRYNFWMLPIDILAILLGYVSLLFLYLSLFFSYINTKLMLLSVMGSHIGLKEIILS